METISAMFFTELCRYIGTREQVFIRRKCTIFMDLIYNILPYIEQKHFMSIFCGSRAEGLILPGSDIDCMSVFTDICVLPAPREHSHQPDLITETENSKPGFVRLRVTDSSMCLQRHPHLITTKDNILYLSSLLSSDFHVRVVQYLDPSTVPHGPCATNNPTLYFEQDSVLCYACRVWPDKASEWIHRCRPNNWPPRELVHCIVNDGFLLVPIGDPNSGYRHIEWRISFSVAEKRLVYSMNHTQLLCYGLLKLYLKHVIESNEAVKDLLCSYFLKTCLFYCIEESYVTWEKENFINCFWTCFKLLCTWVRNGNCPNYFIMDNNMFEGKIFGIKQITLLGHLSRLYSDGIYTFVLIPCLRDLVFRLRGSFYPVVSRDSYFDLSDTELECLIDAQIFSKTDFPDSLIKREIFLHMSVVESIRVSSMLGLAIKTMHLNDYKRLASPVLYHTYIYTATSNKNKYKHFKMLQSYILHECTNGDICSGWLQYSTLCCITGQYNTVIHIVKRVLNRFKSYTMYKEFNTIRCNNTNAYRQKISGRGLTVLQKMKLVLSRTYRLRSNCCFYPREIESDIIHNSYKGYACIPPVVYSNVLLFLSYKALICTELVQYTLNELYIAVHSEDFVTDSDRPIALALLDRCVQLDND